MDKGKIYRIILGNGLKPENFTSIDKDGSIYVTENDVDYKLNGFTKKVIIPVDNISREKAESILKDIKIEKTDEWKTPAGEKKGLVRTEEELKRIKAIKKIRGWHFYDEFVDSEGNVYKKGVLQ